MLRSQRYISPYMPSCLCARHLRKRSDRDNWLAIAGLANRGLEASQLSMRRALLQTGDSRDQLSCGLSIFYI